MTNEKPQLPLALNCHRMYNSVLSYFALVTKFLELEASSSWDEGECFCFLLHRGGRGWWIPCFVCALHAPKHTMAYMWPGHPSPCPCSCICTYNLQRPLTDVATCAQTQRHDDPRICIWLSDNRNHTIAVSNNQAVCGSSHSPLILFTLFPPTPTHSVQVPDSYFLPHLISHSLNTTWPPTLLFGCFFVLFFILASLLCTCTLAEVTPSLPFYCLSVSIRGTDK